MNEICRDCDKPLRKYQVFGGYWWVDDDGGRSCLQTEMGHRPVPEVDPLACDIGPITVSRATLAELVGPLDQLQSIEIHPNEVRLVVYLTRNGQRFTVDPTHVAVPATRTVTRRIRWED